MAVPEPKLRDLFSEALHFQTAEEQSAYLSRACQDDPELRARLDELLQAHREAGSFLREPSASRAATIDSAAPAEGPGTVIGPYKLLQQIGEGGMGTVWMAQQSEPIKRLVAIKLIKAGMDSKQVLARFDAERQALALMDHPNIAKVFDAGATQEPAAQARDSTSTLACAVGSQRPFFVMELVKGVPITKYCDEHHLTPRQRLELFIPVCQAIQHAHQKGIIHRDIKPSNVLVAMYDRPVPKVIDFGVAKATGQQLTEETLQTNFGAVVGTIEYMSPEQASFNQLDVDTRSDIYSLGVLLYELLAGSPPFTKKDLEQAGMLEMLRVIREQEPSKPSTKLSSSDALPSLSANRGTEPSQLAKLVRGELDWIVMKALDKDRSRRYETANALAMDLQRYLADDPVQACPPSARYRLRKFARRNKTKLVSLSVVSIALLTTVGAIGWAVWDRQHRMTEQARQQEARHEKLSIQVRAILNDVERLERQEKWAEALAAAQRADAALAAGSGGVPEINQEVRQHLDDLRTVEAIENARLARGGNEWYYDFEAADRGFVAAFDSLGIPVRTLPAEEVGQRIRAHSAITPALIAALDDWMTICRSRARPETRHLIECARAADMDPFRLQIRDALLANDWKKLEAMARAPDLPGQSAITMYLLATAMPTSDQRINVLRVAQNEHPQDFWLNVNIGLNLCNARPQRYQEAIPSLRVAVALRPQSMVRPILGYALYRSGRREEAKLVLEKSISLHPRLATSYGYLSHVLFSVGKGDEAIAAARKAIELDRRWSDPHASLSWFLHEKGELNESIASARMAIDFWPKNSWAYCNLGIALRKQGNLDAAADALGKAVEYDPQLERWRFELGLVLVEQGRLPEATESFRKAIGLGAGHPAYYQLGVALIRLRRWDEAIDTLREAIRLLPQHANSHFNLGWALRRSGRLDEAIACYRETIRLNPDFEDAYRHLCDVLLKFGQFSEAINLLRRGQELLSRDPNWKRAGEWTQFIRRFERMRDLNPRLEGILAGQEQPADAAERVVFGDLCLICRDLPATAVPLYATAFAAEPQLTDPTNRNRYIAACAAARAATNNGKDAPLDAGERSRYRKQALDWLRADLSAHEKLVNPGYTVLMLEHWQKDPDLIGVRDEAALTNLPESERVAWRQLWSDVAEHLKRTAQATSTSGPYPNKP